MMKDAWQKGLKVKWQTLIKDQPPILWKACPIKCVKHHRSILNPTKVRGGGLNHSPFTEPCLVIVGRVSNGYIFCVAHALKVLFIGGNQKVLPTSYVTIIYKNSFMIVLSFYSLDCLIRKYCISLYRWSSGSIWKFPPPNVG